MKGLPKSIIKKYGISKKAWSVYKGTKRKSYKPKQTSITRSKPMARRRYTRKRYSRKSFFSTQSLFKFIRIGALVAPGVQAAMSTTDNKLRVSRVIQRYTGYDIANNKFDWTYLGWGWMPYLASILATKGISKLSGILRRL